MRRKPFLFISVIVVTIILIFTAYEGLKTVLALKGTRSLSKSLLGKKIVVINLFGEIGEGTARQIMESLDKYIDDDLTSAVVLRIDSPGGTVAASQEIYEEIQKFKKSGKKVVASIADMGASGGYYVACSADKIMADEGSITGSIGVIAEFSNLEGLIKKIGVKFEVIKSGDYKDAGSPWRSLTKKEKGLFEATVNDLYEQFVGAVILGRQNAFKAFIAKQSNVPSKEVNPEQIRDMVHSLAKGQIFSGKEACRLGLIDSVGDLNDAVDLAARLAGIVGKPILVNEKKKFSIFGLLDSLSQFPKLASPSQTYIGYRLY